MKKRKLVYSVTALISMIIVLTSAGTTAAEPLVIDHRHTDISALTEKQINLAKKRLHIAYGHTSHGSQITSGMDGLVGFANGGGKGLDLSKDIFAWNKGGKGGALDLRDRAMGGKDVGYWPRWVEDTTTFLDNPANAEVNVVIWSWCGQMPRKYSSGKLFEHYLLPMSKLEEQYPHVTFVYMTGHVDIRNDQNQKKACQVIRDYCIKNGKVLYDFSDIEHYDPDGTFHEYVSDNCDVYTVPNTPKTGNWAIKWQNSHVQRIDWYACHSAHSRPLNANQKAYAAWALWCALAEKISTE